MWLLVHRLADRIHESVDQVQIKVAGASSLVSRATEAVVDVSVGVTVSVNGVYTPRIVDDRGPGA